MRRPSFSVIVIVNILTQIRDHVVIARSTSITTSAPRRYRGGVLKRRGGAAIVVFATQRLSFTSTRRGLHGRAILCRAEQALCLELADGTLPFDFQLLMLSLIFL